MQQGTTIRMKQHGGRLGLLGLLFGLLLALHPQLSAQVSSYGDKETGENVGNELPAVLKGASIDQHLNTTLPDVPFVDETGKPVRTGDYFGPNHGGKPAVLALVYFQCPMLCSEELDGLTQALAMVHLDPAKDFNILVISIDPHDTSGRCRQKEGSLHSPLRASRYRRWMAFPHRPAGFDRCGHKGGWLWVCAHSFA